MGKIRGVFLLGQGSLELGYSVGIMGLIVRRIGRYIGGPVDLAFQCLGYFNGLASWVVVV